MEYSYKVIQHQNGLPLRIAFHRSDNYSYHYHKELQIFYVIRGALNINTNGCRYTVNEDDIIILNCNQIHASDYDAAGNVTLVIQIDLSFCEQYGLDLLKTEFDFSELTNSDKGTLTKSRIKYLTAEIVLEMVDKTTGFHNAVMADINKLVSIMLRDITHIRRTDIPEEANDADLQRIERIQKFVDSRYRDRISIKDLAKEEYINPYYLSHFFRNRIGTTFTDYLNHVRVEKATEMFYDKRLSITQIALNNGFPNVKSFNKVFKLKHNMTPSEYRQSLIDSEYIRRRPDIPMISDDEYFDANRKEIIDTLSNAVSTNRGWFKC